MQYKIGLKEIRDLYCSCNMPVLIFIGVAELSNILLVLSMLSLIMDFKELKLGLKPFSLYNLTFR